MRDDGGAEWIREPSRAAETGNPSIDEPTARAAPTLALPGRGLDAEAVRDIGLRVSPTGELLVPARDEAGRVFTTRRYAGAEAGARRLADLTEPGARPGKHLALTSRGLLDIRPHVARPPPGAPPLPLRLQGVGAIVTDDEVSAELAAHRLGIPAVAAADPLLVEGAGECAARLAGDLATVVAHSRDRRGDADPIRGRLYARTAAAVEAVGGRPVMINLPVPGTLEAALLADLPLSVRPLESHPLRLDGGRSLKLRLARRFSTVMRSVLTGVRTRRAVALARGGLHPALLSLDEMSPGYHANLRGGVELQAIARSCGFALRTLGGYCVDAHAGAPTRERKDMDLLAFPPDEDVVDRFVDEATRQGFKLTWRIPGQLVWLTRDGALMDIWQACPFRSGWRVLSRATRLILPADATTGPSPLLAGARLDTLRPELVLMLKALQLGDTDTWFPRHELSNCDQVVRDTAALFALLGTKADPWAPVHRGEVQVVVLRADQGLAALEQWREFCDTHVLRRP